MPNTLSRAAGRDDLPTVEISTGWFASVRRDAYRLTVRSAGGHLIRRDSFPSFQAAADAAHDTCVGLRGRATSLATAA